ncbi:MAG TPA: YggS family pyridoxal phosphate-dependent enzyme [Fimbriimonadaceae bacterium]|nr:YggS family pyridoxal phosphate-dependent enzyme [Fimbriimonadaceae bacterium]HRJ31985.1 YggS family pyridoxal phosphate-dependent enzyme [Fimbriimonadaceae bacterium]
MDLAANYRQITESIRRAADEAQRDPATVQLVAVTKTVPLDALREAYDLGLRHFGESKWQEAEPKIAALPADITWHFIGKLQSNKARKVAEAFQVIHTLETESQLKEIAKASRPIDGLIEINIAKEIQKSGIFPETLDDFVQSVLYCKNVRLCGLMTVGPVEVDPERMRGYYKELRGLLAHVPTGSWLSMGMSHDFGVAIQEGATHIRVGTALFGSRS